MIHAPFNRPGLEFAAMVVRAAVVVRVLVVELVKTLLF